MHVTADLVIRVAILPDAPAMFKVFTEAVLAVDRRFYSDRELQAWLSAMSVERMGSKILDIEMLVAEVDECVIGFGGYAPNARELDYLYVVPDSVGRGVGSRLAAAIEELARGHRTKRISLVASLNALGFYERIGYETEAEITKSIDGVDVRCLRMSKAL